MHPSTSDDTTLTQSHRADAHWADELPQGLWLDAAELDDIPYTFLWQPVRPAGTTRS